MGGEGEGDASIHQPETRLHYQEEEEERGGRGGGGGVGGREVILFDLRIIIIDLWGPKV